MTTIPVNTTTFSVQLPSLTLFSDVFRAYAHPVFGLMAFFGSIGVVVGMARVGDKNFNRSVRIYYSLLAITDLVYVDLAIVPSQFLETGIAYITTRLQSYPILTVDAHEWSCKLISGIWYASDTTAGFLLVCLGIERIIAITWPLRAKTILSVRFSVILMLCILGVALTIDVPQVVLVYTLTPLGCTYDLSLPYAIEYIALETLFPVVYSLLSFSFTAYLIVSLVVSSRQRRHLSKGTNRVSSMEVSNAITMVALDVVRITIFFPYMSVTTFGLILFVINGFSSLWIYLIMDIFYNFMIIPHSVNFWIHFFRSPAFRVAIFGQWCAFGKKVILSN